MTKLTSTQQSALELLREAGGAMDYHREVFAFAAGPDAPRGQRIKMQTAQALIRQGLAVAERTKDMRGKPVPDRIALTADTH